MLMKALQLLTLIAALNLTGCSFVSYGFHNLVAAPVDCAQEHLLCLKLHHIARQTWRKIEDHDGAVYSWAFVRGFEDGFVDYVDRNGGVEPPAMPPCHFRRDCWHPLPKQKEIEDWYAGFQRGAEEARQSGLRERAVIPIGMPPRLPSGSGPRPEAPFTAPIPAVDPLPLWPTSGPAPWQAPPFAAPQPSAGPSVGPMMPAPAELLLFPKTSQAGPPATNETVALELASEPSHGQNPRTTTPEPKAAPAQKTPPTPPSPVVGPSLALESFPVVGQKQPAVGPKQPLAKATEPDRPSAVGWVESEPTVVVARFFHVQYRLDPVHGRLVVASSAPLMPVLPAPPSGRVGHPQTIRFSAAPVAKNPE
jgi:hypothetical protein